MIKAHSNRSFTKCISVSGCEVRIEKPKLEDITHLLRMNNKLTNEYKIPTVF